MEQLNRILQQRKGHIFLSYFLLFIFLVSFQSCTSEKDIAASADDFNQIHKGGHHILNPVMMTELLFIICLLNG
jgi:hypothetical protein